jgi:UDP-glucose 4-epimerase
VKVLVTGASGFIGRYIVDELALQHSVEMLDIQSPHRNDLPFHSLNILEEEKVRRTVKGFDAVVHLAGIPHPMNNPPETVFRVNTVGTYNILEACFSNGIRKFVLLSSESTLGFDFATKPMTPLYIPIDEKHSLRPQDPYGLSKVCCELICAGFTRRVGMQTICLRAPWIWVPEEGQRELYRRLIAEYPQWYRTFWAYIHVLDIAQIIQRACEIELPQLHDSYFICAEENWTGHDSRELLDKFYPEVNDIRKNFSSRMSLISSAKANRELGFKPQYSVQDLLA